MVEKDNRYLTELQAEAWELNRTHGRSDTPGEKEVLFGLTGISSLLIILLFGWIVFKLIWFNWMGMPGWW
ncbi:hypothetical protein Sa4125_04770 [Aureimonas sp. SA4125]|uniref:hypothetical protein n=1 Tax=Aureimonas sp. SA4125 TaxID=2826993 RepID=UPI001CC74023|nr:hypothetical protein [Aureimonas sp. SA4125]BDA82935.1 hypothetical protein Sa4125_04770 [Aureimonas sp. SA4125]